MAVYMIDTSKAPEIYRTSNPEFFGDWCIDFQPENIPTIAGIKTLKDVERRLIQMFSLEQFETWFPNGITE